MTCYIIIAKYNYIAMKRINHSRKYWIMSHDVWKTIISLQFVDTEYLFDPLQEDLMEVSMRNCSFPLVQ